jgi:hypothetical protein
MKRRAPAARAAASRLSGALGSQPVGGGEVALEVFWLEVGGDCRQLVQDHLGLCLADGPPHLLGVERVGDDRTGAEAAHQLPLRLRADHPDDLVPVGDQPGDELPA